MVNTEIEVKKYKLLEKFNLPETIINTIAIYMMYWDNIIECNNGNGIFHLSSDMDIAIWSNEYLEVLTNKENPFLYMNMILTLHDKWGKRCSHKDLCNLIRKCKGSEDILINFITKYKYNIYTSMYDAAAESESLKMMNWIIDNGKTHCTFYAFRKCIQNYDLEMLKLLLLRKPFRNNVGPEFSSLMQVAIWARALNVTKWIVIENSDKFDLEASFVGKLQYPTFYYREKETTDAIVYGDYLGKIGFVSTDINLFDNTLRLFDMDPLASAELAERHFSKSLPDSRNIYVNAIKADGQFFSWQKDYIIALKRIAKTAIKQYVIWKTFVGYAMMSADDEFIDLVLNNIKNTLSGISYGNEKIDFCGNKGDTGNMDLPILMRFHKRAPKLFKKFWYQNRSDYIQNDAIMVQEWVKTIFGPDAMDFSISDLIFEQRFDLVEKKLDNMLEAAKIAEEWKEAGYELSEDDAEDDAENDAVDLSELSTIKIYSLFGYSESKSISLNLFKKIYPYVNKETCSFYCPVKEAAKRGKIDIIQFLYDENENICFTNALKNLTYVTEKKKTIYWLFKHNCSTRKFICSKCNNNTIGIIDEFFECPSMFDLAVKMANESELTVNALNFAFRSESIEAVKWVHKNTDLEPDTSSGHMLFSSFNLVFIEFVYTLYPDIKFPNEKFGWIGYDSYYDLAAHLFDNNLIEPPLDNETKSEFEHRMMTRIY